MQKLKINYNKEVLLENLFSIDFFLQDLNIILEVDGPTHYFGIKFLDISNENLKEI